MLQSRRLVAALAATVLAVSACSSGASSPSAGASTPAASAVTPSTGAASPSSAGTPASSASSLVLGISMYPASDPAIALLAGAATTQGEKIGAQVKFGYAPDAPTQQTAIEQLLGSGINVLAIDPNDSTAIATSVKAANTAKVPVIMIIGTSSAGGDVASTIASDEVLGGQKMGEYIIKDFLPNGGDIAFIQGDETHSAFIDRGKGFRAAVAAAPAVKLVAEGIGGGGDPTVANTVAADMITKNPNLKAIFGDDDPMAAGIFSAVQAAGKIDQIAVFGYNGNCPTLRGIWMGNGLKATLYQGWSGFGVLAVDTAAKIHNGETVPSTITTSAYVIDKAAMQQIQDGTFAVQDPSLASSVAQAVSGTCPSN
jgi:ribose transport system substrate-binding protein